MSDKPSSDPRILEALEACRPGSDDLNDPALAFLATELAASPELDEAYERLQQVDTALVEAYCDVPVPDGLADRLLDRLKQARAGQTAAEGDQQSATPPATVSPPPARVSRRWLVVGSGIATAAAAAVLVIGLFYQPAPPGYTASEVRRAAIDFFNEDTREPGRQTAPPEAYPPSSDVLQLKMRWRPVRGFLGRKGVAYDLTGPGKTQATLYVVRYAVPRLPPGPPLRPSLMTGGRATSAWQSGGLLYVLVVKGNARSYQKFLDVSLGPLT